MGQFGGARRCAGLAEGAAVAAAALFLVAIPLVGPAQAGQAPRMLSFVMSPQAPSTSPIPPPSSLGERTALRSVGTESVALQPAVGMVDVRLAALAALGVGLLAASRSKQRPTGRCSRVSMNGISRGKNYMTPNKKGMKPLINRQLASDDIKDAIDGWRKKYRSAEDLEDIMKKTVYGRMQMQWSSEHFTDEIPWIPYGNTRQRGDGDAYNPYSDALYVRKFIEPPKFKKLEIARWEMPENAMKVATLDELVQAGMQYGHTSATWNPKMLQYLYADFEGTHIFDMVQTAAQLNRACFYVQEAAAKGARFIFSGTKEQASPFIEEAALGCNSFFCNTRFAGGLLTNFMQVKESIKLMKKMRIEQVQGAWASLSDETRELNKLKAERLYRKYKGVATMEFVPDIMIIVDEVKERNAVYEAARMGMPVIGLIDSNSNPDFIDIPVPGNASGSSSINLFLTKIKESILKGQQIYNMTAQGDRVEIPKEFDPWLFSKNRQRWFPRKSKRQTWQKTHYGNYENFKKATPYGYISPAPEWRDMDYDTRKMEEWPAK